MGRLTILAFSVAILFSCTTEADQAQGIEKKEIRQSQLVTQKKGGIEETKTPKRASDSLKEIISDVAMSLHNWCIPIVKDMNSSTNIAAEVVEGENGYCRLDYSGYFNELRKLNTISEDFLIAEKERTSACAAFISTITWDEYMNGEAYQYGEECPEFYFMYLLQAQDEFDGVVVEEMEMISDSEWLVTLNLYNDFDERTYRKDFKPQMTVEKEGGNWMITSMKWIEA